MGGYDRQIYGISTSSSGDYKVGHQGWVGVTTYTDMHGNFRVKSEVLVACLVFRLVLMEFLIQLLNDKLV